LLPLKKKITNNSLSLDNKIKTKALYFLSRRDYGYYELYLKLQKYSEDLEQIKLVLDELKHKNYLSEERYINSYLRSKNTKYGLDKMRYDLLQKNVDSEILDDILTKYKTDEYKVAYDVWLRKFNGIIAKDNKQRQRQIRFLQSRGFSFAIINKIINTVHS
jgi:regulatory protein